LGGFADALLDADYDLAFAWILRALRPSRRMDRRSPKSSPCARKKGLSA
jgi:hypothetical protein